MLTPQFSLAIKQLGPTDKVRAKNLGMSRRAAIEWRRGNLPRPLRQVLDNPDLAQALAADAKDLAEKRLTNKPKAQKDEPITSY